MQRIHAPFDGPTLEQIDQEVKKNGVIRLNGAVLPFFEGLVMILIQLKSVG
jgi:hypothetical protein